MAFVTDMVEREELLAMMEFMVKHNISHTRELASLAEKLPQGDEGAVLLAKAIGQYKEANDTLQQALKKCKEE